MNRPTIKQCFEYSNNMEQSTLFFHHFEAIDWMMGKRGNAKKMQNWKSALTGWIKRSKPAQSNIEKATSNKNTDIASKLWVRMTQIYGHKWVSSYGPDPTPPWINLITNLPNEKIAHGLQEMIKLGESWPPALTDFNKMCQSYQPRLKALKYYPSKTEILAQRQATRQARESAMNKIRGVL